MCRIETNFASVDYWTLAWVFVKWDNPCGNCHYWFSNTMGMYIIIELLYAKYSYLRLIASAAITYLIRDDVLSVRPFWGAKLSRCATFFRYYPVSIDLIGAVNLTWWNYSPHRRRLQTMFLFASRRFRSRWPKAAY